MPPTIHFGSLVFEHDGDFNLKLMGIDDPDLTHTGREVFAYWTHPTKKEKNDKTTQLDLDFEDLNTELDPFKSRRVYMACRDQTPADEAGSLATRPPPRLSNAPTLNIVAPHALTQSTLAPRNLSSDFRAAQEDNIQLRTLLGTMGALVEEGTPLAKIIE